MIDERLEIVAAPLALGCVEDQALEPGFLEIIVERRVVLEIDFRAAAAHLVERRLGNEEVPVIDELRHLPVEEGQQERSNVGAVDVGVGHDHDLVIAQLRNVEVLADPCAKRLDHRPDFFRRQHSVEPRAFDVQELAAQRKDRLVMPVAPLLCRTAG